MMMWRLSGCPGTFVETELCRTLDGYAASHRAVREMQNADMLTKRTKLRSSRYLNNIIEQGHRGIKSRTRPMLGFKNLACTATTIAGIELLPRLYLDQGASGWCQGSKKTDPRPSASRAADGTPRFIWLPRMLERP
jgi:hypothetical protein